MLPAEWIWIWIQVQIDRWKENRRRRKEAVRVAQRRLTDLARLREEARQALAEGSSYVVGSDFRFTPSESQHFCNEVSRTLHDSVSAFEYCGAVTFLLDSMDGTMKTVLARKDHGS